MGVLGRRALTRLRRLAWRVLGPPPTASTPAPPPTDVSVLNHWDRIAMLAEEQLATGRRGARYQYTWAVLHAADVARSLGIPRIAALEFGCAGGNGLVALELAAELAEARLGVAVDVHGFDTAAGLPSPADHRDAPYLMQKGQFPMDEVRLRARLSRTRLHLGLVRETIGGFADSPGPPVGFIAFDLDYYSSTIDALMLFDAPAERFLPRVLCYFDDTLGYPWGDSNGERLAIRESNERRAARVIDRLEGMRWLIPHSQFDARWTEALYLAHILDHPRYADEEGTTLGTRLDLQN